MSLSDDERTKFIKVNLGEIKST